MKLTQPTIRISLSACFATLLLGAWQASANHKSDESITTRITPVGHVCIQGQPCQTTAQATSETVAATPVVAVRSGVDIYNTACAACHNSGAAGAPKLGDAQAWSTRTVKGLEGLLATAISGINAMPPRGLCMDCSDTELGAAIEYILDNSK